MEQSGDEGETAAPALRRYRNALEEIERVCDEFAFAGGTMSKRIRAILRKVRRGGHGRTEPLDADEERRRRRVYGLELTDRESGRVLGITGQGYQAWRQRRGLPPWRRRGRRPS
jgi:hypothetical protein